MKFIGGIIGVIILGYFMQLVTPWWSIALAAMIITFAINQNYWKSFLVGFFGAFLLWGGFALIKDMGNNGILSAQIGDLLQGLPPIALVLLSGIIGGLVGGLSGLLGYSARELI